MCEGGWGEGAEALSWARPARHTTYYYQTTFSCKFFFGFFLFFSPHHSIFCWALDSTSLPLLSRSHHAPAPANPQNPRNPQVPEGGGG